MVNYSDYLGDKYFIVHKGNSFDVCRVRLDKVGRVKYSCGNRGGTVTHIYSSKKTEKITSFENFKEAQAYISFLDNNVP
jgi:hypothetical protein